MSVGHLRDVSRTGHVSNHPNIRSFFGIETIGPPFLKKAPYHIMQPVLNSNSPCSAQVYRLPVPHHLEEGPPVHPFTGGEHGHQAGQAGAGYPRSFTKKLFHKWQYQQQHIQRI